MRSFVEYRKNKIENSFQSSLRNSINAQFDIFRYDLLESIKLPQLLFENDIEHTVFYRQKCKEDYKQLSCFVENLIHVCKSHFYNHLITEAEKAISDPYADFQTELVQEIEKMFGELKDQVSDALAITRGQKEIPTKDIIPDEEEIVSPGATTSKNVPTAPSKDAPTAPSKGGVSTTSNTSSAIPSLPKIRTSDNFSVKPSAIDTSNVPVEPSITSPFSPRSISTNDIGNPSLQSIFDLVNKKPKKLDPFAVHTDVVSANPDVKVNKAAKLFDRVVDRSMANASQSTRSMNQPIRPKSRGWRPDDGLFKGVGRLWGGLKNHWGDIKDLYHGRKSMRKESFDYSNLFLENATNILDLIDAFKIRMIKFVGERINEFKIKITKTSNVAGIGSVENPRGDTAPVIPRAGETTLSQGLPGSTPENQPDNKTLKGNIKKAAQIAEEKLGIKIIIPQENITKNNVKMMNVDNFLDKTSRKPVSDTLENVKIFVYKSIHDYITQNYPDKTTLKSKSKKDETKYTLFVKNNVNKNVDLFKGQGYGKIPGEIFNALTNFGMLLDQWNAPSSPSAASTPASPVGSPQTLTVEPRREEWSNDPKQFVEKLRKDHPKIVEKLKNAGTDIDDEDIIGKLLKTKEIGDSGSKLFDLIKTQYDALIAPDTSNASQPNSPEEVIPRELPPEVPVVPLKRRNKSQESSDDQYQESLAKKLRDLVQNLIPENLKDEITDDDLLNVQKKGNTDISNDKGKEYYQDDFKNYIEELKALINANKNDQEPPESDNEESPLTVVPTNVSPEEPVSGTESLNKVKQKLKNASEKLANSGEKDASEPTEKDVVSTEEDALEPKDIAEVFKDNNTDLLDVQGELLAFDPDGKSRVENLKKYKSSLSKDSRVFDVLKNNPDFKERLNDIKNETNDTEAILVATIIALKAAKESENKKNGTGVQVGIKTLGKIINKLGEVSESNKNQEGFQKILTRFRELIHS